MNEVFVLKRAKELISDEESWHKGFYTSVDGKCLCSLGALSKAVNSSKGDPSKLEWEDYLDYINAHNVLKSVLPIPVGVHTFNDLPETTHKDIMEVFDKAIEKVS